MSVVYSSLDTRGALKIEYLCLPLQSALRFLSHHKEILPLTGTQLHARPRPPSALARTKQALLFKQMSSPAL